MDSNSGYPGTFSYKCKTNRQTNKKLRKNEFPRSCEKYPQFILIVPFHRMLVAMLTVK